MNTTWCDFKFNSTNFSFRTQQNGFIWEVHSGLSTFPEKIYNKKELNSAVKRPALRNVSCTAAVKNTAIALLRSRFGDDWTVGRGSANGKLCTTPCTPQPSRTDERSRARPRPALTLANGAAGGRAAPPGAYLRERRRRRQLAQQQRLQGERQLGGPVRRDGR